MDNIKVGHLVPIVIIEDLKDQDSFLTSILGKGMKAILPKKYAIRDYKVGEYSSASIYSIDKGGVLLSQKFALYYRKIVEHLLYPLIQSGRIKVKRVATITGAKFVKVSVEGIAGEDPVKISIPYIKRYNKCGDYTITLVKYTSDLKQYVINSLAPAPKEGVKEVIYLKPLRKVLVIVDPKYLGLFLGKGGLNVVLRETYFP